MTKHTILFLAANPRGTHRLAVDREERAIRLELQRSRYRACFELVTRGAAEPLDLLRELRELKPTVVHFSGHGGGSPGDERRAASSRDIAAESAHDGDQRHGLFFDSADGGAQFVRADAVKRTFGAAGASVQLVVLNACHSEALAADLLAHVDCVVGIRGSIGDDGAQTFSIGFYGGLGAGESVAAAWRQGRAAISVCGFPDSELPQLAVRPGIDAEQVVHVADVAGADPAADGPAPPPPRQPASLGGLARVPPTSPGPPIWLARLADAMIDLLSGGPRRRLRRAITAFDRLLGAGASLDVAQRYGRLVRIAVRIDARDAVRVIAKHDRDIPDPLYIDAFPACESWLLTLLTGGESTQQVSFEIAGRLGLRDVQCAAASRIALARAEAADREALLAHLERCRTLGLLDRSLLESSLPAYAQRHSVVGHPGWARFLGTLSDEVLPETFVVQLVLGRGKRAAQLARSDDERRKALACCLAAKAYDDAFPSIGLAEALRDDAAVRSAHETCGDIALATLEVRAALDHYRTACCVAKQSACHERLGEYVEALNTCTDQDAERLSRLADHCELAILQPARERTHGEALRRARHVVARLRRAAAVNEEIRPRLERAERIAGNVLATARADYAEIVERSSGSESRRLLLEWSAFEESASEIGPAAELAERAGELLQASILWERDRQYGEAVRVLGPRAAFPEVKARVARLRQEAGDHLGAARLYQHIGDTDSAIQAFTAAGAFAAAAQALLDKLGVDRAIFSDDYLRFAGLAGASESVARGFLEAVRRRPNDSELVLRLSTFLNGESARELGDGLRSALAEHVRDLQSSNRARFDASAAEILGRARNEVEKRYTRTWGLDLGTTKCVVAIFDTVTRKPVICDSNGRTQFASTVAFDAAGREFIGLTAAELVRPGLRGAIVASKRLMGTDRRFRIGDRQLRPEEVAARLIAHGRSIVERFVRDRIAARVLEIARAEFGDVLASWISEAMERHLPDGSFPDVVVTIPAHFGFKQKKATRDACEIAGVRLLRLVHEPTAACMAARSASGPEERIVVVDLGAGTLDLSLIALGDRVHEVEAVFGDNDFGGNDIDRAIAGLLARDIEQQYGIRIAETGLPWRRLLVAAEHLKIELSSASEAMYTLPGFLDRDIDVEVKLTARELRTTIHALLGPLRDVCNACLDHLRGQRPRGFLPVGGQMLAPIVRQGVASALNLMALNVDDSRTLVARGACLQAAIIGGALHDALLLDVVPFSLGIKVRPRDGASPSATSDFSRLIKRHATIPTRATGIYTTTEDNQPVVQIGVYQGEQANVEDNLKMGEFLLEGIPPTTKGVPEIEVTFDIDASGVLNVSAVDKATKKARSIRIEDTTMLSPHERTELTRRFAADRAVSLERERLAAIVDELHRADPATAAGRLLEICAQWKHQLADYERSPTDYEPSAEDGAVLVEMFGRAAETDATAALAAERAARLQHDVAALSTAAASPRSEAETGALRRRAEALLDRLHDAARDVSALHARIVRWTTTIGHLAQAVRDPMRRFAACHAARNYAQALDAFEDLRRISGDLQPRALWEAALECLAAIDDRAGYRARLAKCSRIIAVDQPNFDQLDGFCRHVRSSIAWIDTPTGPASGFLVSDRLVATARTSISKARDVVVTIAGVELPAMAVFAQDCHGHELALIQLPQPVDAAPLRLGYSQLVEIGEAVAVIAAVTAQRSSAFHDDLFVECGIVNRFRGADQTSRLFELSFRAQRGTTGSPLFNDLGEVIGVMSSDEPAPGIDSEHPTSSYAQAINVSALRSMLVANAKAMAATRGLQS